MKRNFYFYLFIFFLPAPGYPDAFGQASVLDQKVFLPHGSGTVESVLQELGQKGGIIFSFSNEEVPVQQIVSVRGGEQTIREHLEALLGKNLFLFRVKENKVILKKQAAPAAGKLFTLSGYVRDSVSGEMLAGASLYVPSLRHGTGSNRYGFYSLALPAGAITLAASFVGYRTDTVRLVLRGDTSLTFSLKPTPAQLAEIVVEGEGYDSHQLRQPGLTSIPVPRLKAVPTLLGEADILKALALTPGISTGNEGTAGLLVRGGTPDQNLILLDEAPVYNVAHLFGLVSIFNADAVKGVDVYKAGFPARFGGRLSSVIDVTMKEGDNQKLRGEAGIGLIGSRFTLEGPLSKSLRGRTSFMLSGRASYLGLFLLPNYIGFKAGDVPQYFTYWLYDTNAKLNHRFKDGSQLMFSFYRGTDFWKAMEGSSAERSSFGLNWGNTTATARYNRVLTPKLFFRSLVTHAYYGHGIKISSVNIQDGLETPGNYFNSRATVRDWTAKVGFDAYPGPAHQVKFGVEGTRHTYLPNGIETSYAVHPDTLRRANTPVNAAEGAVYAEDDITFTRWLRTQAGLRAVAFQVGGRTYTSLEPRANAVVSLPGRLALKASHTLMRQFIHLLVSNSVGLPNDIWVPATGTVPPQFSQQTAFGITKTLPALNLELSLEGYYKTMRDVIDYQTGVNYLSYRNSWESQIEKDGTGRSYGLEFFANRTKGRFTGWASYTLAWNWRQFANINGGAWYLAPYDRRHNVALTGNYAFNKKFNLSANWVYHSGQPTTVPIAVQENFDAPGGYALLIYGERNNYRMPAFHRLDVAANLVHQNRRGRQVTWSLGLYNAYARKNPFFLDIDREPWVGSLSPYSLLGIRYRLLQKSVFPLLPIVTYSIKF